MDKPQSYRTIDVVLYDDVNLLDVSGPVQAFKTAKFNGRRKYRMRYLSLDGANVTTCCGMILGAEAALRDTQESADLLIPGGTGVDEIIENQSELACGSKSCCFFSGLPLYRRHF